MAEGELGAIIARWQVRQPVQAEEGGRRLKGKGGARIPQINCALSVERKEVCKWFGIISRCWSDIKQQDSRVELVSYGTFPEN